MKKVLFVVSILFLSGIYTYGQYQVKTKFVVSNNAGQKIDKLIFGVHQNGSDSVDLALGENYDLPPNPPQSELFGCFYITNPTTLERTGSYVDLRGLGVNASIYQKYQLRFQRGMGDTLFFNWLPLTSAQVDSAFLTDNITDNILKINLMNKDTCIIANSFLNNFNVHVWYKNPLYGDVVTNNNFDNFKIRNNYIYLNNQENLINASIYDINGIEMLNLTKDVIDINNFNAGIYFIIINYSNGSFIRSKFIKY